MTDGLPSSRQVAVDPSSSANSHAFCAGPRAVRSGRSMSGGGTGRSRRVRVSIRNRSARRPNRTVRNARLGSPGSGGRMGSHSDRARKASALRSGPWTVTLLVVVVGAVAPRAVGEFVVVERADERVRRVRGADVRVGPVLAIAPAVVVERLALVQRVERSADVGARRLRLGRRVRGLVDRVAQVDDGVEVVALGEAAERIEEARIELGARHLAEPEAGDVVGRERPRAPDLRVFAVGLEAVVVAMTGFELVDIDGDRPVALGQRGDRAGLPATVRSHVLEPPGDRRLAAVVGRDTRPDDDAVGRADRRLRPRVGRPSPQPDPPCRSPSTTGTAVSLDPGKLLASADSGVQGAQGSIWPSQRSRTSVRDVVRAALKPVQPRSCCSGQHPRR